MAGSGNVRDHPGRILVPTCRAANATFIAGPPPGSWGHTHRRVTVLPMAPMHPRTVGIVKPDIAVTRLLPIIPTHVFIRIQWRKPQGSGNVLQHTVIPKCRTELASGLWPLEHRQSLGKSQRRPGSGALPARHDRTKGLGRSRGLGGDNAGEPRVPREPSMTRGGLAHCAARQCGAEVSQDGPRAPCPGDDGGGGHTRIASGETRDARYTRPFEDGAAMAHPQGGTLVREVRSVCWSPHHGGAGGRACTACWAGTGGWRAASTHRNGRAEAWRWEFAVFGCREQPQHGERGRVAGPTLRTSPHTQRLPRGEGIPRAICPCRMDHFEW